MALWMVVGTEQLQEGRGCSLPTVAATAVCQSIPKPCVCKGDGSGGLKIRDNTPPHPPRGGSRGKSQLCQPCVGWGGSTRGRQEGECEGNFNVQQREQHMGRSDGDPAGQGGGSLGTAPAPGWAAAPPPPIFLPFSALPWPLAIGSVFFIPPPLPHPPTLLHFPILCSKSLLLSAFWASLSSRDISRNSRRRWKVRSSELGLPSRLLPVCSARGVRGARVGSAPWG